MDHLNFDDLFNPVTQCLVPNSLKKIKTLVLGAVAGLDCLSDANKLKSDGAFSALTEGGYSDSTPSVQYGKKMEGLAFNYKDLWCLDSLSMHDHLGLTHAIEVRKGSTYSSNGSVKMIEKVLKHSTKSNKFFHADSAFSNIDHYNSLNSNDVGLIISLSARSYGALLKKNLTWKSSDIVFFDHRKCEVAHTLYRPQGLQGRDALRVVLIRSWVNVEEDLFGGYYNYYAFVTNIGRHEKLPVLQKKYRTNAKGKKVISEYLDYKMVEASNENMIEFYRARGNTENWIREHKNGLDLKHYPCQKLNANRAFGRIVVYAHNLMRYSSFSISKRGCFSKRIRFKLVSLACQVVKHARTISVRMKVNVARELEKNVEKLRTQFLETLNC